MEMAASSGTNIGGQPRGLPTPLPFRAWLNRSWIDLAQPAGDGHLTAWGIELAYQAFVSDDDLPRFNSIVATNYRLLIADVARSSKATVAIMAPDEVPLQERCPRWMQLCDAVLSYEHLPPPERDNLVWLLHRLCFHGLVVRLTGTEPTSLGSDVAASLQVTRTIALACLSRTRGENAYGSLFQALWPALAAGSPAAVEASYHLLIEHAKTHPDATRSAQAAVTHQRMVEQAAARLPEFRAGLLWSRFYRARAFVPMLAGDMDAMVHDMDLAERMARSLVPGTEAERHAAAEILWPVLESRVREAQALGDLPLAERRARTLIDAAPLNPRAWLHLGEVLLSLDRFEHAVPVYREAHRLGPPASAVALFNLGQCHEMLDQAEPAMDAYAELLQLDPLAISAAERIASIAADHGGRYTGWADAILGSLTALRAD